ncbi:MAG TPA: CaiB/BaiF CoA-transferase family protein [Roseiarcus sp.]|jgi:alpha-methylacyl-CoA racemase
MPGPLAALTVIELAGLGPSPFACMMFADMGARVVRVDRPPARGGGAIDSLMRNDGFVDRGRVSLAVDLKHPEAVEAVLRLVEKADILVEGYRPGVAERIGLGPDVCLARNPRLVYGRMTGWGQSGPLAKSVGHDINYIALSGALHPLGYADRPPSPPLNLVGDYGGGGMYLAVGLLAAHVASKSTGRGQVVDAAMTDGAALLMAPLYGMMAKGHWVDRRGENFLDGAAHFYRTYECADGKFIAVGAIEPHFYKAMLERCGIADPDFADQWRRERWAALGEKLAAVFRARTRDEWSALFEGSDACVAPVLSMCEAAEHPHNASRGTFVTSGGMPQPAPGPRFAATPSTLPDPAPETGQHTCALLQELGYSPAQIGDLLRAGGAFVAEGD